MVSYQTDLEKSCIDHVYGEPTARVWHSAIVLQGPYHKESTPIVIREFLERNREDVLIIVSTYLPPDTTPKDLLSPFELDIIDRKSLYNGRLVYIFVNTPPAENVDFWKTNKSNQNLQRLSSFVGLRHALKLGISLSLKIRTDFFLGMQDVTRYLGDSYIISIPIIPRPGNKSRAKGRIIASDCSRRHSDNPWWNNGMYFVADNWFFGYTEDLLIYFDISDKSSWRGGAGIGTSFGPENNLCELWIKDMDLPADITLEELSGRYMAIVDSVNVEAVWIERRHDYQRYLKEGKPYLLEAAMKHLAFSYTEPAWRQELSKFTRE